MEESIKSAAYFVALIAEAVAIAIIFLGILKSVVYYLKSPLPLKFDPKTFMNMRMQLGGTLSLSLEYLIGADILKTAISPTWNEVGLLGAIVLIRTVLNYFLMQEMKADK